MLNYYNKLTSQQKLKHLQALNRLLCKFFLIGIILCITFIFLDITANNTPSSTGNNTEYITAFKTLCDALKNHWKLK